MSTFTITANSGEKAAQIASYYESKDYQATITEFTAYGIELFKVELVKPSVYYLIA